MFVPMVRLLACAAAAAVANPAFSQQYIGEGGTLLDRNTMVGSGGKNTRARDVRDQIWFNNQIITGNAPAGRSFRGYVGYTSPNDFRGLPGSDRQYGFRRDSASASAVATGVRASDALRYQFALTTGQAPPSYLASTVIPRRDSTAASAGTETATNAALRSTSDFLTSRSLRPTFVGSRTNAEGEELVASASTLLGVTWQRLNTRLLERSATPRGPAPDPLAEPVTPGAPEVPATTRPAEPVTPGAPPPPAVTPTGLESRGRMYRPDWDLAAGGGGRARPGTPDALAGAAKVDRSVEHARMLDAVRTAYASGQRPEAVPAATEDPSKSPRTPGSADEALERIQRVLKGMSPFPTSQPSTPGPDPLAPGPEAKEPTDPTSRAAAAPAPARGAKTGESEKREPSPLSPELLRALKSIGQKNLETLVPTAGEATNPVSYRTHMESGQRFLTEGRYFDAEDRFTRAIAAMPNDPLAKIGRVHAQLGAGMFLSASTNLRQLIKDSPEVVGLKFDRKLAPDAARAESVARQLREGIEQGSTGMGLESALLLSYLGRITGDDAMTVEGLDAMRVRLPSGDEREATFYELLRGVWTGGPAEDKPAGAK